MILEVGNKRMKKIIELIAVVAVLAVPVFAGGSSQPVNAAQDQCTAENKLAWYNEFRQNFKGDTAKANELARSRTGDEKRVTDLARLLEFWMTHGKPRRESKPNETPET